MSIGGTCLPSRYRYFAVAAGKKCRSSLSFPSKPGVAKPVRPTKRKPVPRPRWRSPSARRREPALRRPSRPAGSHSARNDSCRRGCRSYSSCEPLPQSWKLSRTAEKHRGCHDVALVLGERVSPSRGDQVEGIADNADFEIALPQGGAEPGAGFDRGQARTTSCTKGHTDVGSGSCASVTLPRILLSW